jgi:ADP-ribosyl-[dinitrogen reductase] hydrolase
VTGADADPRRDRALGAVLGLAVGDALGTTVEFEARGTFPPVTGMTGGGPFNLKPGEWTDDTSMALCLLDSLAHDPRLDERDLMDRFVRWWRHGENSVTGRCFDIGITTRAALSHYERTGDPIAGSTDPHTSGNGGIMRLAPVVLVAPDDPDRAADLARRQSRTTHSSQACLDAADLLARILVAGIGGAGKEALRAGEERAYVPEIAAIANGAWRGKTRDAIASSGYVVHTLEAAVWCVERGETFADAMLTAVNLGDDADSVAAVAGQIAGALWGAEAIPTPWRLSLAWNDRLWGTADGLQCNRRQTYESSNKHSASIDFSVLRNPPAVARSLG